MADYVMNCRIMSWTPSPVIIIPARMAASRLPGKPLADIGGKPMICHVWERAKAADIAPVWVATDHEEIAAAVRDVGGEAVMTRADHPSGSDRTFEAVSRLDPDGRFDVVLNLQGDLPEMDPAIAVTLLDTVRDSGAELSTLVTTASAEEAAQPQVVKAVVSWQEGQNLGQALYFSRAVVPHGEAPLFHHIGVYGWRRDALASFVALPPSPLETAEKLEQLRALEAGMRIAVAAVAAAPAGVDTEADLARTRARLS
jgi:3-deoxy-manno-octulosonate cytidylyltransferase (CMP-KDO synthetase)|tara:strand:+ start:2148 stop:2915 length:768 start_codon:yes stop_codon:yes gene_type:complete